MRLSMSTECAIHGLLFLALHGREGPVLLPELARRIGLSEHTLRKVFQALASAGILTAYRGVKGGYALARDPSAITLQDIVEATEGSTPVYHCLVRQERCDLGPRCAVGSVLARAAERVREVFEEITLREMEESVLERSKKVRWSRV